MVIDTHMHIGDFPMFNVSITRAELAEEFETNDIETGVVFCPDNTLTRETVESIPRAYGFYWANPKQDGFVEAAIEYLNHSKFLGVKMHPLLDSFLPNDPIVHPLIRLLISRDTPVLFHCGHPIFSLPWSIEELALNFPEAKIILGHMGHSNIVYINAAIDIAERNPNVYLETSGMPMHKKIKEAFERVGDRVLYGSDVPFHDPSVEIHKIKASGLDASATQAILYDNAELLFSNRRN